MTDSATIKYIVNERARIHDKTEKGVGYMKKNTEKWTALLMTAVMAAGLTGCGNAGAETQDAKQPVAEQAQSERYRAGAAGRGSGDGKRRSGRRESICSAGYQLGRGRCEV